MIYHLSSTNLDNKILKPRVPKNFFIDKGFEDGTTPRVCFSTSIDGSLAGISQNIEGKEFYVHIPEGKIKYYQPTNVPDSKITKEVWVKDPVKLKCLGIIKVGKAIEKPHEFKYGGKYVAELYFWNWKWKSKTVPIINEFLDILLTLH